jgi:archaemetzincin
VTQLNRGLSLLFRLLLPVTLIVIATHLTFRPRDTPTNDDIALPKTLQNPEVDRLRTLSQRLAPLHQKLRKPGPDDWLAKHTELGQTFHQYLVDHREPLRDRYETMYVQPLGEFTPTQRRLLDLTADFLGRFYACPVTVLDPVPLDNVPASARRFLESRGSEQFLTSYLLNDVLKPRRPDNAVAVLGLTATDLWPAPGWNYVFGQASLSERVGVWSINRYGDPDESAAAFTLCLRRTLATAAHETGHMLGIPHCIAFECCMNGSNHLAESDSRPLEFCPECQPKIWWTCRADPETRCERLIEFGETHRLDVETQHWRTALKTLTSHRK